MKTNKNFVCVARMNHYRVILQGSETAQRLDTAQLVSLHQPLVRKPFLVRKGTARWCDVQLRRLTARGFLV